MRAIELADVGRAYGERVALAGVTLALEEGETLAVFGSNGAGKTTLLRILATLLRPHHGVARVLERELPKEGWAVRGRIGFLGHEPLLYRDLTARENLRFHARLHGVRLRAHRRAAGRGRDARAGRRSRAHVLARDGPAHRGLPRAAARARAAAARRAAGGPGSRARWRWSRRCCAVARGCVISHDVEDGLAEADLVLGPARRPRRAARARRHRQPADVRALYA